MTGAGGWRSPDVAAWEARGRYRELVGHRIFTVDVPSRGTDAGEPVLVIHGFPTSSFDFRLVVDALAAERRVLLFDMLGYGLSDKPDIAYRVGAQADIAAAFLADLGVERCALLTHDLGDTVGGELLARQLEGTFTVEITRRVLTNGSIYIAMAHLSPGQLLLLDLPDERIRVEGLIDEASLSAGLAATFSPHSIVEPSELAAQWDLVSHGDGHLLLPRLIRYIEERRRDEARFTGAIEAHPSPLAVVWGLDDPIAVPDMVDMLAAARPDASLDRLAEVGHYPMVEAPRRFADAVAAGLTADPGAGG